MAWAHLGILGNSVAKRPIFLLHFDKANKDILTAKAETLVQPVRNRFVKGLLRLKGSSFVERQLDNERIRTAFDAEIKTDR